MCAHTYIVSIWHCTQVDKCKTTHNTTRFIIHDTMYSVFVHVQLILSPKLTLTLLKCKYQQLNSHVEVLDLFKYKFMYAYMYIQTGLKRHINCVKVVLWKIICWYTIVKIVNVDISCCTVHMYMYSSCVPVQLRYNIKYIKCSKTGTRNKI